MDEHAPEKQVAFGTSKLGSAILEKHKKISAFAKAIRNLLNWLKDAGFEDVDLPFDCKLYPSGEFARRFPENGKRTDTAIVGLGEFTVTTKKLTEKELQIFILLIKAGFLEKIIEQVNLQTNEIGIVLRKISETIPTSDE